MTDKDTFYRRLSVLRKNLTANSIKPPGTFRQMYHLFRVLLENSLTGYFIVQNHKFLYVNSRMAEIFGYTVDEMLGLDSTSDIISPEGYRELESRQASSREGGGDESSVRILQGVHKNGDLLYLEIMISVNKLWEQPVLHGNVVDITKSHLAQEALRVSEKRYRAIVEDQNDLIVCISLDGTVTFVNQAVCHYLDQNYDEIIGRPVTSFLSERDQRLALDSIRKLSKDNLCNIVEYHVLSPTGKRRCAQWNIQAITDEPGNIVEYQAVGRDITDRKALEDKLRHLSLHDSLTGLYNRAYFEAEMFRLEGGRHDPIGIIMCDLDGLKLINDSLGHSTGDILLKEASQLLKGCFRTGDMVARIGGDEFVVLLPGSPLATTREACKRLRRATLEYNALHPEVPFSMSIGYSAREKGDRSLNQVLMEADNYMYREKLRNRAGARGAIVNTLLNNLSRRDLMAEDHSKRMQVLIMQWSRIWKLPEKTISNLLLLAQFHDIGKVGVPDEIIFKPGPLTADEIAIMRRHCEIGYQIALATPDLTPIADLILKHHEWWNGQGYPLGLKGDEIPQEARMLAILDAYDVITNERPFRLARSHGEALEELRRCSGAQFDPALVEQFTGLFDKPDCREMPGNN